MLQISLNVFFILSLSYIAALLTVPSLIMPAFSFQQLGCLSKDLSRQCWLLHFSFQRETIGLKQLLRNLGDSGHLLLLGPTLCKVYICINLTFKCVCIPFLPGVQTPIWSEMRGCPVHHPLRQSSLSVSLSLMLPYPSLHSLLVTHILLPFRPVP